MSVCLCVCLHTMCARCLEKLEVEPATLELEVWMLLSGHVGENQISVLYKSSKYSLTAEPALMDIKI